MFYPYDTISAAQACESDDRRLAMSHFLSFFLLFWVSKEPWHMCGHMCFIHKNGKGGRIWRLHLDETSNWDSLRAALWRNWPSNAASEGCRPWIETRPISFYLQTIKLVFLRYQNKWICVNEKTAIVISICCPEMQKTLLQLFATLHELWLFWHPALCGIARHYRTDFADLPSRSMRTCQQTLTSGTMRAWSNILTSMGPSMKNLIFKLNCLISISEAVLTVAAYCEKYYNMCTQHWRVLSRGSIKTLNNTMCEIYWLLWHFPHWSAFVWIMITCSIYYSVIP